MHVDAARLLAVREAEVFEKEKVLSERKNQCENMSREVEILRDDIRTAEVAYSSAAAELADLERERTGLQPRYELALTNRDQRTRADKYRAQIAEGELKLQEYDATATGLDSQLAEVSARYKAERDRRSEFERNLKQMVNDLRAAIASKIMKTASGEGDADPFETILAMSEITKEREREIRTHARHVRELDAVIDLKRRRAEELEMEAARQLLVARDAKDAQITQLVAKFQAERETLTCDIEQVRRVNAHQLEMLRGSALASDAASVPTTRAEANLEVKSKELSEQKKLLQKKCQEVSRDKAELMKALKLLKERTKKEEEKYEGALKELDGQIYAERQHAIALERENVKLEQTVDGLAQELRKSKQVASRRK